LFGGDTLLGLLTNAVQTLAGVLLPSATVFLLLLCNDKAVLGPWVNGRWLNLFTGAVIWALVMLSLILTAATVFPAMTGRAILVVLGSGTAVGAIGFGVFACLRGGKAGRTTPDGPALRTYLRAAKAAWRMPPLEALPAPTIGLSQRIWMGVLRAYLIAAVVLVIVKVVQVAAGS